jgi:hypothetical protein
MERRLKKILATSDFIEGIFKTSDDGVAIQIKGIEQDAILKHYAYDIQTDHWYFIFYHSSYPIVKEGDIIPNHAIKPHYTKIML